MRVVEPQQFTHNRPAPVQKKPKKRFLWLAVLLVILGPAAYRITLSDDARTQNSAQNTTENIADSSVDTSLSDEQIVTKTGQLRQFSDNEFKVFYDNLLQPDLLRVENPPSITGNDIADTRIRKIAEDRGYRLRSSPSVPLSSVEGQLLHTVVIDPWKRLKSAAALKGLQMSIVSGYRSENDQRNLFLQRLSAAGASVNDVADGKADAIINQVLITTSIPGYSKHHTGYTIDLLCAGYAFENFKNSPCHTWLTADNYKIAKEHGFIPSYPSLAELQGPDPEAWEYVWVGTEKLYQ